jgi:MFS transporter, ACDE family, multidrug resistance protein
MLLAGRFLQGIGAAGLINLAVVIIGDHWEGERRTQLIGRNAAMLTVGLASFPLLSGVIAEFTSWRVALLPQAFGLIVAVWAWRRSIRPGHRLGGNDPRAARRPRRRDPPARDRRGARERTGGVHPDLRRVLVDPAAAPRARVRARFGRPRGDPVDPRGDRVAGGVQPRPDLVASAAAPCWSRHGGVRGLVRDHGAVPVVWVVALACALYGLGDGALIPILQDTAVTEAPPEHRGAVVAMWVGAARLGQTIGPLLAAAVFTATSTSVALFAGAALAGCCS